MPEALPAYAEACIDFTCPQYVDMLVDTHVRPSVAATRGHIPRLHASLHTSESGSDRQLRFRSSISPRRLCLNLTSTKRRFTTRRPELL